MAVVPCTSCVKLRMRSLAQLYHKLVENGDIPLPTNGSVSAHSIGLMKDAFRIPPVFHIPSHITTVPLHCLHLDLLDITELQKHLAVSDESFSSAIDYVKVRVATADHLFFAFLLHTGPGELEDMAVMNQLYDAFRQASRAEGSSAIGSLFVEASQALLQPVPPSRVLFGCHDVSSSILIARGVVVLLMVVVLCNAEDRRKLVRTVAALLHDAGSCAVKASSMLARLQPRVFATLVEDFQLYLTVELMATGNMDDLTTICSTIALFYKANFETLPRDGLIPFTKFYSGYTDDFGDEDIREDVVRLYQNQFAFSRFPFLINPRFKSVVLQLEASVERDGALRQAIITNLFTNQGNTVLDDFFLVLKIDRHNLVSSAVRELRRKSAFLRRPLRVQFIGEEGVDEGGLMKEFFQLLLRELLHPNYNMFSVADGSQALWFVSTVQNASNMAEFHLIGQCIGLAVYNNIILDIAFPQGIFRKLLGVPLSFSDLADVDPHLYRGMKDLLAFEETAADTVENVFCRTFVYEHDVFGQKVEVPLVSGGEGKVLTADCRQQFVDALTDYVLDRSIADNFNSFRDGFFSVCTRGLLSTLRPEELELLVCGVRVLNFDELEQCTTYEGFDPESVVIQNFWQVLHGFSEEEKKKFLKFCTGSDRIPVGGIQDLHFIVGKNGDDSELLPTSHTCFNHLLLPAYCDKAKLQSKLQQAIENCEGFYGGK